MKCCLKCNQNKTEADFSFKVTQSNKLQPWCKSCQKIYKDKHYQANRKKYIQKNRTRVQLRKEILRSLFLTYLADHPCVDCGETDPIVLEFDHVRGKSATIATMRQKVKPWADILQEIKRCDVRCANCHKRKTAIQFGWYKARSSNG